MRCIASFVLGLVFVACTTSDSAQGGDAGSAVDVVPADVPVRDGSPSFACGPPGPSFVRCHDNPLLLGWRPAGTQFEWTQADPTVLFDEADQTYKMWFSTLIVAKCADAILADKRRIVIKYAESADGLSWNVQSEPALDVGPNAADWDHSTVETPSVIKDPSAPASRRFALLYAGFSAALPKIANGAADAWQIGLATSPDGRHFQRDPATASPYYGNPATPFADASKAGLVLYVSTAFPDVAQVVYGSVADPEVRMLSGGGGQAYDLWFSSAGAEAADAGGYPIATRGGVPLYGISHAKSNDLIHWTAEQGNPLIVGGGQPTVVQNGATGLLTMLYGKDDKASLMGIPNAVFETRGFWEATSMDGLAWTASSARVFTWDQGTPYEDLGLLNGAALLARPGELRLYYDAFSDTSVPQGSCVFTNGGASVTAGANTLNLATRAY